ncbi:DUF1439 domain-containing protein [Aliidiomarina maris]|uniref:Uncharacterized protein DUF1439 n=1 Tax=Aliidiomarina maris TaxID=531312 RepID=A0A327X302_9GAMM|nr:DUF1439 domain-containing protein [Aliidiomarina maris]MBA3987848.1 hypothetical protein [Idiomarina sp.]MCL5050746.1 DUF1439 domain-containing protein [Bacillota bacterium]RAJ97052.1 uncharacterized protein DUF1439 [Aliidiomarina maris]RUO24657.1 hypothetical protein CWE07_08285 [Aliidiomarina maris]
MQMKRRGLWAVAAALVAVTTVACAQMGQLINYTIGAEELEEIAKSELAKQNLTITMLGASARLTVDELGIGIDENGDGKVQVRTASSVNASMFGREYPVGIRLTMSGAPRYSAADHAIYVTGVTLDDSMIDTGFGQLQLQGLNQEVYALIHDWLEQNPVYRFDPEDSRYRLLQQLGLDISVEPGQLRIQSAQR